MSWAIYSPLFVLPVFLLVIAIFRLRLNSQIVGQFQAAIILLAISLVFSGMIVFFDNPQGGVAFVFLSGILGAVGWLLFATACLRLAWKNRMPEADTANRQEQEPDESRT